MSQTLSAVLARLKGVRRCGRHWAARCPAHPDRKPSLSIREAGEKILLHCHAGCRLEDICAALGVQVRELFSAATSSTRMKSQITATYDYCNEKGTLLYQVLRFEPKDFKQRRPNGKKGWNWNLKGVRRVLYRLSEVLKATSVIVCEGEKDCETARSLDLIATCNAQGAGKWRPEFSDCLRGKSVTIIADADPPGRAHAQEVARSLSGKVTSLKLMEMPGAKDLTEWVELGGSHQELDDLIQNTPEWTQESVEGTSILGSIFDYVRKFVSLSESQARVAVLWVVHTHVFSAADATPYLAITSAEKQSGKTRLLEVLETLVAKPWLTGRVSAAVLARKIDQDHPTLLLDESDAAFRGDKEYAEVLRGVLNTGHRITGKSSCCVGQGAKISSRDFSTFCPKAIAGIGGLPDTVADRSIPIRLKRAARDERVQRFRLRDVRDEAARLQEQTRVWCQIVAPKLRDARPLLPEELTDRQQDGAEPLLAIADAVGGEWPAKARAAVVELFNSTVAEDGSVGVQLLSDLQDLFNEREADSIPSAEMVEYLVKLEGRPWAELSNGKPITPARLARLLKRYDIAPRDMRIGGLVRKGYLRSNFPDAWKRYCTLQRKGKDAAVPLSQTAEEAQQARQSFSCNGLGAVSEPLQNGDVAEPKLEGPSVNTRIVAGVASPGPSGGVRYAFCYLHQENKEEDWWQRPDGSQVCSRCRPRPLC
jgi:5S rRNA maturation endonuclease (ribonuclease M5)